MSYYVSGKEVSSRVQSMCLLLFFPKNNGDNIFLCISQVINFKSNKLYENNIVIQRKKKKLHSFCSNKVNYALRENYCFWRFEQIFGSRSRTKLLTVISDWNQVDKGRAYPSAFLFSCYINCIYSEIYIFP